MKFQDYLNNLNVGCDLNENLKIATDAYSDLQNTILSHGKLRKKCLKL